MAFTFGGQQNKPLFGSTTTTTSASTGFGGFGTATTTSSGPTFGGFGQTATSTSAPSTGLTFGGFGQTATSSAPSTGFGFGATSTTTAATGSFGFGTGLSTGTGTTGFGTGTSTGFGTSTGTTGFGTGTTGFGTGTSGFGTGTTGFGTGTGLGTGLSLQNKPALGQQPQQQNAPSSLACMASAVSLPLLFGDERDAILAKWNQLQAFWGTGKGYYNQQGEFVTFKPDNPFCRFKAVGYSCQPRTNNSDGLVGIIFSQKKADIVAKQQQAVDILHKILGSKPQFSVCVEGVKEMPDNKTEMIIYIQERSQTGATKRITATELFEFLMQTNTQQQLQQQLGVENVVLKTGFSSEQLKFYLDNPPAGIDPLIWQQAKLDNPNPSRLIPVPMVGFKELYSRLQHQQQQTKLHQARLEMITHNIAGLQRDHSDVISKIEQYKRKFLELSHRVLQVMVKQEIYRKLGYAIQADEEQLRVQLEAIQVELNAPTQFKGRLNELMSQMRMQNHLGGGWSDATYQMDDPVQDEIRQHLKQQQVGLQELTAILKDDLDDLKLIEQGLSDASQQRKS